MAYRPETLRRIRSAEAVKPGCVVWLRSRATNGYGYRQFKGKRHFVHRLAWLFQHGEIPSERLVLHHESEDEDDCDCGRVQAERAIRLAEGEGA